MFGVPLLAIGAFHCTWNLHATLNVNDNSAIDCQHILEIGLLYDCVNQLHYEILGRKSLHFNII